MSLRTLHQYPLHCPDCGQPQFKCLNFYLGLWRCYGCGATRFVSVNSPAYQGLPPVFVEDFPYPEIINSDLNDLNPF